MDIESWDKKVFTLKNGGQAIARALQDHYYMLVTLLSSNMVPFEGSNDYLVN